MRRRQPYTMGPMTVGDIQLVIDLELSLLSRPVRRSAHELLDPDFREIGTSGRLWTRAETISALTNEPAKGEAGIRATELAGEVVSPGLVQLIYVTDRDGQRARRSSLWRRSASGWRMVFHQGTPLSHS